MAQELRSINLVAPAFKGINTEDSPIAQDPSFAEIADNAVIDKRGRIASRKGHTVLTTDKTALGSEAVRDVHEYRNTSGATTVLSVGNNKVMTGTSTLTDISSSISISASNWKIVNFNDKAYFFQRGTRPLVYDGTVSPATLTQLTGITAAQYGNEVISAYGRLWTADTTSNKSTVYWSDLLIGNDWSGGTSGSIDIAKVWPDGYDEIVALAAHNGLLIIFGQHSIVVYQGAEAPATMALVDTVAGVGCVDRDTIQHTGTDVLFLSHTGLRSFGRTIQEKSMPISTLSKTITKDIIELIQDENTSYRTVYSPEESFYLLTFVGQNTTYCFDLRGNLEDGSLRATRWPNSVFTAYERLENGKLYIGSTNGISEYKSYLDNGSPFRFKYYSPSLTFGDPSRLKFIKKINPTIITSSNTDIFIKFAYDFNTSYRNTTFTVQGAPVAEFGASEYVSLSELSGFTITSTLTNGVYVVDKFLGDFSTAPTTGSGGGALLNGDSYSNTVDGKTYVYITNAFVDIDTLTVSASKEFTGGASTTRKALNAGGSGSTVVVGLEADINGSALSLQEINILALIGKTV